MLARLAALTLASGSSILVAARGWTEATLPSNGTKGSATDHLYLFIASTYTLAAIAVVHGLAFWLDAFG